jgi:hypothetical protein
MSDARPPLAVGATSITVTLAPNPASLTSDFEQPLLGKYRGVPRRALNPPGDSPAVKPAKAKP